MRSSINNHHHHYNGDSNNNNIGGTSSSSSTNNRVLTKGKVVIIGEYSVGKTSLVQRYITKNRPTRTEPTIGAAFQVATVQDVVYKPTNQIVTQPPILVSSSSSTTGNSATSSTSGGGGNGGGSSLNAPGNRHSRRLSNVGIGSGGVSLDLTTSGGAAAPPRTMTVGSGPTAIHIPAAPQTVTLEVWDTAGSERYRALMPLYFRDAAVAVVCFDLGNVASFDRVGMWLAELRKHNAMAGHDDPALEADEESGYNRSSMRHSGGDVANGRMVGIVKILCGTKADLRGSNREVSSDEAIALAEAEGMIYFETSAKVGMNVSTMFQSIAQSVYSLKVDHLHADVKRDSGGGDYGGGTDRESTAGSTGGSSSGRGTGLFGRKGGAAARKVDLTKEGNTNKSTPKGGAGGGPKKRCSC